MWTSPVNLRSYLGASTLWFQIHAHSIPVLLFLQASPLLCIHIQALTGSWVCLFLILSTALSEWSQPPTCLHPPSTPCSFLRNGFHVIPTICMSTATRSGACCTQVHNNNDPAMCILPVTSVLLQGSAHYHLLKQRFIRVSHHLHFQPLKNWVRWLNPWGTFWFQIHSSSMPFKNQVHPCG